MSYSSLNFFIFLLIICIIFYIVPKKLQWLVLLIASIFFYCFYKPILGVYLFITIFSTWMASIIIYKTNKKTEGIERSGFSVFIFILAIILNFGIMAAFKMSGITIFALNSVGFSIENILLPIGLSFYTFQTIGYLTDVFRYSIKPEKNFFKYFLFASFFPQILSGPIGRFDKLSPQLFSEKSFNGKNISMGAQRIVWGLIKKMVIADRIGIIVNEIFDNSTEYSGFYIMFAVVLFIIQLYADFSGLIDIATGASQLFNINLAINFNAPLLASNITDFWSRWHISLSNWFKDYLFYPLLKSRLFISIQDGLKKVIGKRKAKNTTTYIAMFILWFSIGCWHGLEWHYILGAGVIFGFYIISGRMLKPVFDFFTKAFKINKKTFLYKVFEVIRTFMLLEFALLFWRASSVNIAVNMFFSFFKGLNNSIDFFKGGILELGLDLNNLIVIFIGITILFAVDLLHYNNFKIREWIINKSIYIKWPIYLFAIMTILLLGIYGPKYIASDFIYFKF